MFFKQILLARVDILINVSSLDSNFSENYVKGFCRGNEILEQEQINNKFDPK